MVEMTAVRFVAAATLVLSCGGNEAKDEPPAVAVKPTCDDLLGKAIDRCSFMQALESHGSHGFALALAGEPKLAAARCHPQNSASTHTVGSS